MSIYTDIEAALLVVATEKQSSEDKISTCLYLIELLLEQTELLQDYAVTLGGTDDEFTDYVELARPSPTIH